MFKKGDIKPRAAGRKKGTPNRKTEHLMEIADRLRCHPFEILCHFAMGNEKALGYSGKQTKYGPGGMTIESDWITQDMRLEATKEICTYLYPKRKALEVSNEGDKPFEVTTSINPQEIIKLIKLAK